MDYFCRRWGWYTKELEKGDDLLITYWTWAAPFLTLPWEMGQRVAHETVLTVH